MTRHLLPPRINVVVCSIFLCFSSMIAAVIGSCTCPDVSCPSSCSTCSTTQTTCDYTTGCAFFPSCDAGDVNLGSGYCFPWWNVHCAHICTVGSGICTSCQPGYYGYQCLNACPPCVHGTCGHEISGTGTCICDMGWTGTLCQTAYTGPTQCSCDYPNAASPLNHFTCTNSSFSGYCASTESCTATSPYTLPASGICKPTCSCDHPLSVAPGNHFTCTDTSLSAYCSSTQTCNTSTRWARDQVSSVCTTSCTCDNPGQAAPFNHFTCSNPSESAYCSSNQKCNSGSRWRRDQVGSICT